MSARTQSNPKELINIYISNLSYEYPDGTKALSGINFSACKGKCITILGANGSGKTTLLYTLIGVIPRIFSGRVSGSLKIFDMDIQNSNLYDIARKMSIVQQNPENQILFTTVEAECSFAPSNFGIDRDIIMENIKSILEFTGLEGFENRSPNSLSYGQKQRLAIAASLTNNPEVLLLDEPFTNIDSTGKAKILSILKKLKLEKGLTLIISTHDISEIIDIVDYVLLLSEDGKQLAFKETKEIFQDLNLIYNARVYIPPLVELSIYLKTKNKFFKLDDAKREIIQLLKSNPIKKINLIKKSQREINRSHPQLVKGEILLETINLDYSYPGGKHALKNINFKLFKGDFLAIIGENGSGKTTLIKNLIGLLRPYSGKILYNKKNILNYSLSELSKIIGISLQNPEVQLLYEKTAYDEIAFSLRELHLDESEIDKKVRSAAKLVDLEQKLGAYPAKLSFGQKKKLVLASLIASESQLIILDEPFFGLDYFGKTNFVDLLKSLNKKGFTIIVITHNIDFVAEFANKLIVLSDGRIILQGDTEQVLYNILSGGYNIDAPTTLKLTYSLKDFGVPICYTMNEFLNFLGK